MKCAFLSYAHANDKHCGGKIRQLLSRVQSELQQLHGSAEVEIFIDRNDIQFAQQWRVCIDVGLAETAVMISIISPHYLNSEECRREYDAFLQKEKIVLARPGWDPRDRMILPLLFRQLNPEQKNHRIWADCKNIQNFDIEAITASSARSNSENFEKCVKLIAKRIYELHRRVAETSQDQERFTEFRPDDELNIALRKFSRPLLEWPSTLCNDNWIKRAEFEQLVRVVEENRTSTRFLVGPPGSGKSAILARLCSAFAEKGFPILGVKSDQLPRTLETLPEFCRLVLGNDRDLVDEIRRLSAHHKTVVIIDQLDALASLADLRSGRLNVMLDLIAKLRDCEGIHIIASMRTFELEADQRLSSLVGSNPNPKSEIVELANLTAENVTQALAGFDVFPVNWPQEFLTFLGTPYHLAVFTEQIEQFVPSTQTQIPDAALFSSIQAIHQAKFSVTVELSSSRTQLEKAINDIVERIEFTESLWQRITDLQSDTVSSLKELEKLGWICQRGGQVAFAHQTQYEFLSGRRFANDPGLFVDHVYKRRNGLFVRPVVWHGLALMRNVNPKNYLIAVSQLLARKTRRHLYRLLLEFLAEVSQPMMAEIEWVQALLRSPDQNVTMCWLLRGKADWFKALSDGVFEELMAQPSQQAWPVARLIEESWPLNSIRTTDLLRRHWAFRQDYVGHMWVILSDATDFSDEMITWLMFCASEQSIDNSWIVNRCLKTLCQKDPDACYRVVSTILNKRLDQSLPDDAEDDENVSVDAFNTISANRIMRTSDVIDAELSRERWYGIEKLAELSPDAFVRNVWPWFARILGKLAIRNGSRLRTFREEPRSYLWFADEVFDGAHLLMAMLASLKNWAIQDRTAFLRFLVVHWNINSMTAQRMVASALTEIADQESAFILAFFRHDSRRFFMNRLHGHEVSRLIQAVIPHWNRSQIEEFQNLALSWHMYRDQGEPNYMAEYRAGILCYVPLPLRIPAASEIVTANRDHVEAEQLQLEARSDLRMKKVEPPLTTEVMLQMTDGELIDAFNEIFNEIDKPFSSHDRNRIVWDLADEFGKLTKTAPVRALQLIKRFNAKQHEAMVGTAVRELGTFPEHCDALLELIFELDQSGFTSASFRDDVGRALRDIAVTRKGLPDDICELLSTWMLTSTIPPASSDAQSGRDISEQAVRQFESILWPYPGSLLSTPENFFYVGEAMKLGYCLRKTRSSESSTLVPFSDDDQETQTDGATPALGKETDSIDIQETPDAHLTKWIDVFRKCIPLDYPSDVWQAWLWQMVRYVPAREPAAQLMVEIFQARPDVLETDMGVRAFARFSYEMSPEVRATFLAQLFASQQPRMKQGVGELATLIHLEIGDPSAKEIINRALDSDSPKDDIEPVRLGIAFASAKLWRDSKSCGDAIILLSRLLPTDSESVTNAILQAFNRAEPLEDDDATRRLLEAVSQGIRFRHAHDCYSLIELLSKYVILNPKLTFSVIRRMVDGFRELKKQDANFQFGLYDDKLVSIVLTIHRQTDTQLREDSLTLYEDLMELEVSGAFEKKLRELDLRPKR